MNVFTPALCVLIADRIHEQVKIAQSFVKLGAKVSINLAPECGFPPGQSMLEDPDRFIADVKAIGSKLSKKIARLGYKKLPKAGNIVTGSDCPLKLPKDGPFTLNQTEFRFVLVSGDGQDFRGAIVQNHIVFFVQDDQALLPNQPIYGNWSKRGAILSGNDPNCRVELHLATTPELKCRTINLGPEYRQVVLDFPLNVVGIINSGPGSVVIESRNDRSLYRIIAPSREYTLFVGDTNFTYTIDLVSPATKAKIQACTDR